MQFCYEVVDVVVVLGVGEFDDVVVVEEVVVFDVEVGVVGGYVQQVGMLGVEQYGVQLLQGVMRVVVVFFQCFVE